MNHEALMNINCRANQLRNVLEAPHCAEEQLMLTAKEFFESVDVDALADIRAAYLVKLFEIRGEATDQEINC